MSLPEKPAVAAHVSDNAENGLDVIQRSNIMDNYAIWIPERDGHAPPFWQDGMVSRLCIEPIQKWSDIRHPHWDARYKYRVPSEAVNGPAADDARDNADFGVIYLRPGEKVFDPAAWLAEGHANLEKLPAGVVLPEPPDWADKLVNEWKETPLCEALGLADFIRTHCQPREVSNG